MPVLHENGHHALVRITLNRLTVGDLGCTTLRVQFFELALPFGILERSRVNEPAKQMIKDTVILNHAFGLIKRPSSTTSSLDVVSPQSSGSQTKITLLASDVAGDGIFAAISQANAHISVDRHFASPLQYRLRNLVVKDARYPLISISIKIVHILPTYFLIFISAKPNKTKSTARMIYCGGRPERGTTAVNFVAY